MKLPALITKHPGEIAVSVAALVGWGLLTASIAGLSPRHARGLWSASTGLLLLSLCGWRFLRTLITDGLYVLTRSRNG